MSPTQQAATHAPQCVKNEKKNTTDEMDGCRIQTELELQLRTDFSTD